MLALLLALFAVAWAGPVHVLTLKGGVDPGSASYLLDGIAAAEAADASAVVIELDTPGGLLTSTRDIVTAELTSKTPVIVYVSPSGARAGSAGVFITLAAHVAAMAPGTTIGAAHPVSMFGEGRKSPSDEQGGEEEATGGQDDVMEAKILNDTLAWARAIATERGRNAEWAEAAVRESAAITDREAVENRVVDMVASDLGELLRAVDGRVVQTRDGPVTLATAGAEIVRVDMTLRQRIVHFLGDPNVLFVLIGLGLLGLYIEYQSPGLIIPGVAGVLCLLGAGVGLSILPFQLGGLLLVLAGFVAIGLEAYIGGKGIFAILGTGGIVVGGLLMFEVEGFDLRVDPFALGVVGLVALVVALGLGVALTQAQRRRVLTGAEGMVGLPGVVTVGGSGAGRVRVQGEDWAASWQGTLEPGAPVRVLKVDGPTLLVEPAAQPQPPRGA